MNTSALKAFAPAVRRDLMEAVSRKLDVVLAAQSPDYRTTFAPQVAALGELARADRAGLVERVAYTWFNRLTALRYLDARGWHPFRARVLTAATAGDTQPELLRLAREGALPAELARHTNPARLDDLLDGRLPSPNAQGEVYRHLVLAACRFYNALLPDLFERLDDATELLLPDDLLTEHSFVQGFRTEITDDDCADVEVLGWLYQFYIADKKSAVMARKTAVPTEDIPAVTQLFTPHWIVRYLVENSLGRLWLLNRPQSRLREQMPYYVETEPESDFLAIVKPEEIRLLDPAVGSGHMLTCAFDLLYAIYEEEGYAPSDIPGLILTHNLYGVDIDPRAAQIAQLALVLKARERSRRFFQSGVLAQPNVIALENVRFDEAELREYVRALGLGSLFDEPVMRLLGQFEEATTFGSLIQPVLAAPDIAQLRRTIDAQDIGEQLLLSATHQKVLTVLAQAGYLARGYNIVVANPPYLGGNGMNTSLKQLAQRAYRDAKSDLYAMFILRATELVAPSGFAALVTMQSWMFLSTFEALRRRVLAEGHLRTLIQIGYNSFPELNSKVVRACAFVLVSRWGAEKATYVNLNDAPQSADKERLFFERIDSGAVHRVSQTEFDQLPGAPLAYWVSEKVAEIFSSAPTLDTLGKPRQGIATGDNERFLRYWWEPSADRIGFGMSDRAAALQSAKRWFPCNKGGAVRRWYGNLEHVVDWEADGARIRSFVDDAGKLRSRPQNLELAFREGMTWSTLTTSQLSMRLSPQGQMFETKGSVCFFETRELLEYGLAFANTALVDRLLTALAPTADYHEGPLGKLPFIIAKAVEVRAIAQECIAISRADWDDSEVSWDFGGSPLVRCKSADRDLEEARSRLAFNRARAAERMRHLERQNNELFIGTYGLEKEISADVDESEITLTKADTRADAAALLSYAVGCMLGRYSLDTPGLVLADAGDTVANYLAKVGKPAEALTFAPDADGIIPVLDGEWFEDDVVARTRDFLRATFGEATLRENIRWLEESLGKDLRRYFATDFYKDHLQTYRKRPIYWLVQSPKKGFSVLVYLHRYTRDTLNVVLNRYLREYQGKLRSRIAHLAQQLAGDTLAARDRTAARKEQDRLTKVLHECEEWERQALLPLAQQRIALDLDDGVKVNYLKLGDVLAPIPGLAAKAEGDG